MARRVRQGRRQAPARKFVWARQTFRLVVAAEDTTHQNLLSGFETEYAANLLGATVMRLRGVLTFEPAAAATAICAAGVIVGSSQVYEAVTAGDQTGGPLSDEHADWMAYEPVILNDAAPGYDGQIHKWDIDVKSNRKLEELGDGLFLVVENDIVGVALNVTGIVSIGLKLP